MQNDEYKELLDAVHRVDKKVDVIDEKIDGTVAGQFKEHDRRIGSLELNQRWVALAVIGACIASIMAMILK